MKRAREDNTISVILKTVSYFKIPVAGGTVKEALRSHPYYPAFKSICDALNEWKIENYPLRYKPEELKQLAPPYIVHFENGGSQMIAFVTDIQENKVTYYDSYKTKRETGFDEFIKKCSGAVILLNPDENSGEKDYRKKWQNEVISRAVIPLVALASVVFLLLVFPDFSGSGVERFKGIYEILLLTKVIGIVLSILLVLHEFEIRSRFTDKLCHLNKAINCNTVLNDKASKIFGWFGWADAGIIYFTGCLLFLLLDVTDAGFSLIAIFSALSIPYPVFSIWYQGFVLKKWCPFCLCVQLILITEFILMLPFFSNLVFSFTSLVSLFLIFLIVGVIYSLFIMYTREKISNEDHYYRYLGFKKNPVILRSLILNQKHFEIPVANSGLVFGRKDSTLKITAFLSLHCSHCARAFEKIKELLRSDTGTAVNLVLVTSESKIIDTLYHYKKVNKENEALELIEQWFNTDPYSRNKVSSVLCIPDADEVSQEINNENTKLFKELGVFGTPTFFINGYQLPHQYDIDDIKYFSEVFCESKEIKV
ncbi:MAG: vitamin K epoxide reductase family protein [Bacteroidota bacterium]